MSGPDTSGPLTVDGRFAFGSNWSRYARRIDEERLAIARDSLREMLGADDLKDMSFLDAGCGSGLFSLAASRLGAERVHSIDFDPESVATAARLREALAPHATWTVERGDVLDPAYMSSLGEWDVVYSWGVLHHTGDMWTGLDHVCARVRPSGRLFISIYNDQGWRSDLWRAVKRAYNALPQPVRTPFVVVAMLPLELRRLARHVAKGELGRYVALWRGSTDPGRGMSYWHDIVDWIGGYPFEVARPEEVFDFCSSRGFELRRLRTDLGSHGCNEFVFERTGPGGRAP